jgi:hypothetical protein
VSELREPCQGAKAQQPSSTHIGRHGSRQAGEEGIQTAIGDVVHRKEESKTQLYELNDGQEDLDRYDDAGTALDEKSRKDLFDVCRFFLFFAAIIELV